MHWRNPSSKSKNESRRRNDFDGLGRATLDRVSEPFRLGTLLVDQLDRDDPIFLPSFAAAIGRRGITQLDLAFPGIERGRRNTLLLAVGLDRQSAFRLFFQYQTPKFFFLNRSVE
jgi:hypothetical protein